LNTGFHICFIYLEYIKLQSYFRYYTTRKYFANNLDKKQACCTYKPFMYVQAVWLIYNYQSLKWGFFVIFLFPYVHLPNMVTLDIGSDFTIHWKALTLQECASNKYLDISLYRIRTNFFLYLNDVKNKIFKSFLCYSILILSFVLWDSSLLWDNMICFVEKLTSTKFSIPRKNGAW